MTRANLTAAGQFYRGKDDWMRQLTADPDISPTAKAIGCYLALRISMKERTTFPQQTTIAKDMGISRATVIRAIAELVASFKIEVIAGPRGRAKKAVNRYALIMPWAVQSSTDATSPK